MKKTLIEKGATLENKLLLDQMGETKYGRKSELAGILFRNINPLSSYNMREVFTDEEFWKVAEEFLVRYPDCEKVKAVIKKKIASEK